ncbi:MAG: helix-turn-helix transcriptional regulator [Gammaproteobacteria bacterium]|nr:helix-turn-helix transcriptional regulator [Acidimicrobiaceae bacterium]MYF30638.1 helix-turn-helix transcriptional regulator [Gammaproteobacteria bacterium]MYJ99132.1 helix-turn-helix transcriptional regulator [Acidimicrobiaceae bacterium]
MGEPEGLGQRIRARRTALGMTLAQVAEESGLSLPYVSNLERGRGNPTLEALRSVAAALQQTVPDLLGQDASEESFDPAELVLADAPKSLRAFMRSERFLTVVERLSSEQETTVEEMRRRLLIGMASAPRRSADDPTEEDWRRLLDAYSLILSDG